MSENIFTKNRFKLKQSVSRAFISILFTLHKKTRLLFTIVISLLFFLFILLICFENSSVYAADEFKIIPDDGAADENFGYSVAINSDGHRAVVGNPSPYPSPGAAYIFEVDGDTWKKSHLMTAGEYESYNRFGHSVAISADGNIVVVGAPRSDAAYVFEWKGYWETTQKLTAPGDTYEFGESVAISDDGNVIVVGAPGDDGYFSKGAAYTFLREDNDWDYVNKLVDPDGNRWDFLGGSVATNVNGNTIVVGASRNDNSNGSDAGAAYIFTWNGSIWVQQGDILLASDGANGDWFGSSVSINRKGDVIIIGADSDNNIYGSNAGAAYIFERDGSSWNEIQKLTPSEDAKPSSYFGISVDINADRAVVGAFYANNYKGAVYVFERNGNNWVKEERLIASDGEIDDYFGDAVAISSGSTNSGGKDIIVGAEYDDNSNGANAGAAYVFTPTDPSPPPPGDFVHVCGDPNYNNDPIDAGSDDFCYKGKKFDEFIGVGAHPLLYPDTRTSSGPDYANYLLAKAKEMNPSGNPTVLRIFAPHKDKTWPEIRSALKTVLDKGSLEGYKFIVVLTDFYNGNNLYIGKNQDGTGTGDEASYNKSVYDGNVGQCVEKGLLNRCWFKKGDSDCNGDGNPDINYEDNYKPFVEYLLTSKGEEPGDPTPGNEEALKNHEAIFAWELGNEIQVGNDPSGHGCHGSEDFSNTMLDFAYDMGAFIKGIDPNHMLTTGFISTFHASEGVRGGKSNFYTQWEGKSSHFDFISVHGYNNEWTSPACTTGSPNCSDFTGAEHFAIEDFGITKPYLWGEIGFNRALTSQASSCHAYPEGEWVTPGYTIQYEADPSNNTPRAYLDQGSYTGVIAKTVDELIDNWGVDGILQWGFMPKFGSADHDFGDECGGMDEEFHFDWQELFDYYSSKNGGATGGASGSASDNLNNDDNISGNSSNYDLADGAAQIYDPASSAIIESTNLLESFLNVGQINSFNYDFSSLPATTSATIQFSQNGLTWYDSQGNLDGMETIVSTGYQTIDLAALGWTGPNFYYKATLTSNNGIDTPTLDGISVAYTLLEANIKINPTSHDFGDVNVESTSTPQLFTIINEGNIDLEIQNIQLTGTGASEFNIQNDNCSNQSLTTSNDCTLEVVFSPSSEETKSASLSIPSSDPDTPTLNVSLVGKGLAPAITIVPATHNFGSVVLNDSETQSFTITNTGDEDLNIGSIDLTGINESEFNMQNDNCSNQTVLASETCTVEVVFSPTSEGAKSTNLSIPLNDPITPIFTVSLSGTGSQPVTDSDFWITLGDYEGEQTTFYATSLDETGDGGVIMSSYDSAGYMDESIITRFDRYGNVLWAKKILLGQQSVMDRINSIIATSDAGYAMVGKTNSDHFVAKLDTNGDLVWAKVIEGTAGLDTNNSENALAILETADGDFIVAGNTQSSTIGAALAVIKLDSTGNIVWSREIGESGKSEYVKSLSAVTGGYILTGHRIDHSNGRFASFLMKVDTHGSLLWAKFNQSNIPAIEHFFAAVQEASDGSLLAFGDSSTTTRGFGAVYKFDSSGDFLWGKNFDNMERGIRGVVLDDDTIVIEGMNSSYTNAILMKLNSTADSTEWVRVFDTPNLEFGNLINFMKTSSGFGLTAASNNGVVVGKLKENGTCIEECNLYNGTFTPAITPISLTISTETITPVSASHSVTTLDEISDFTWDEVRYLCQAPSYSAISVDPTLYDFGEVNTGEISTSQSFTISNTGNADLEIQAITVTGADASEFSIQNDTCSNQTLTASGTCILEVVFSPTTEGVKSANLSIPSNDPDTPSLEVLLEGIGNVPSANIPVVPPGGSYVIALEGLDFTFTSNQQAGNLSVTYYPGSPPNPGNVIFLNGYWDITASMPNGTFSAEVTFPYTDEHVSEAGLSEQDLNVFYSDDGGQTWLEANSIGEDTEANTITIQTDHFSLWAIGAVVATNQPPTITLLEPDGVDDSAETSFTITWTDDDPDNDAGISLYYDTDNSGEDGTLIVDGLSEDDETDQYLWDTTNIADGTYYVYAVIDDGVNAPVVAYSDGPVTIVTLPPGPTPTPPENPIPEPTTFFLMGLGLFGLFALGLRAWRKKK